MRDLIQSNKGKLVDGVQKKSIVAERVSRGWVLG